jgi:hypothetical protein
VVEPGAKVRFGKIDPRFKDKHKSNETAKAEIEKYVDRMSRLQYLRPIVENTQRQKAGVTQD